MGSDSENSFFQKTYGRKSFATACAYWDLDEDRNQIKEKWGENADYYPYKVLGKGISADETTYNGRSTLGWDAIAVTDHCKNMDAVLKVIDFLASEEGQYLMLWGIEGEDWNYVDGKRTPDAAILAEALSDINQAKKNTGIRRWSWFIKTVLGVLEVLMT